MEWVLRSPEVHSIFSYLGFMHADRYHVNENCNAALQIILNNILTEDKYLRAYRRSINCGQNIQKDLIPLLIHAKDDKTIELLVKILVNLSIPTECLLSQTGFDLHTIFEINQLLISTKEAFTGPRTMKVVVDFLKNNAYPNQPKVPPEQCINISNCLQLLRNILHIPEDVKCPSRAINKSTHSMQNQIIWNMFSQSIDKVLIKLIVIPKATKWVVTMVQLIALLYKDQHGTTLHKLLNIWLESCNSESSEDNESNTSPLYRGSEDFSLMLTSDSKSDSSDMGGSEKRDYEPNCENDSFDRQAPSENTTMKDANQPFLPPLPDQNHIHMRKQHASAGDENMTSDNENKLISESSPTATTNDQQPANIEKKAVKSETSNCGYGMQIKDEESISTSSNDDEEPAKKPVRQRPHNPKQRRNIEAWTAVTLHERTRKKLAKRGKANIIYVHGFQHQTPTDNDISNVLKEFTIDFLRKGYNSLVQKLHTQILTNILLEIDMSHFFWLITYFLKFATQIKLDLLQISAVLSFDIVTHLTAEGVNLCEEFEMAIKQDRNNLTPTSRRLHLVVTSIRELVQAVEEYKKFPHICAEDKDALVTLQNKMCETDELKSLFVLLLRRYNPEYYTKQYLQDLIVTNHILLTFADGAMRSPGYTGSTNITDHMKQFTAPEIMCQYGLLLEDYAVNGEFVNDCVFTVMHHVAGELDSLTSLHQPKILKTFISILQSDYEICDDWSDLVHYVINTFTNKHIDKFMVDTKIFENLLADLPVTVKLAKKDTEFASEAEKKLPVTHGTGSQSSNERWTTDELSTLSSIYLQCKSLPGVVGKILKCLKENGIVKSGDSVMKELYKKNIINKGEYEKLSKAIRDVEIRKLCEQLRQDRKTKYIDWVQQVLLEVYYAKLQFEKSYRNEYFTSGDESYVQFKLFNQEYNSPVMSPVSYHALQLNQPVPLVPWNCEQAAMCEDVIFLKLLHKLSFLMPVVTDKVFIRIPHVWSADVLYEKASSVAVIDTSKLKFSVSDITSCSTKSSSQQCNSALPTDLAKDVTSLTTPPENLYQKRQQKHLAAILENLKSSVPEGVVVPAEAASVPAQQAAPTPGLPEPGLPAPDLPAPEHMPPKGFTTQLSELEDCDSISETVSIASDFIGMYISDED